MAESLRLLGVTLLVFVAGAVHVVVHEAAHALVAGATGIDVPEVSVGDGRAWLRFRLFGTVVKLGVSMVEPPTLSRERRRGCVPNSLRRSRPAPCAT